jgi:uncharacterized protein YqeY
MTSLSDRLLEDLKTAMKAKDTLSLSVLRGLKSAIKYAAIEEGGAGAELDDTGCQTVIRKELKKRDDAAQSFAEGGRPELAEKEKSEAEILKRYLPAELPESEVVTIIDAVILELGASSRKDMGPVMKMVQERTAGAVDNKQLSGLVMSKLS